MKPLILIPARMASSRFPGKPLREIAGKPMILHVVERAAAAKLAPVVVACGEHKIQEVVQAAGGEAILTDPEHPSGTDRIWEAVNKYDPEGKHDIIINVQGDLPTLAPKLIHEVLLPFDNPQVDIATLVTEIRDSSEITNPNVVKAVVAWGDEGSGRALYFTRATAPYGEGVYFHHIGIYAYRRAALEKFVNLPPSPLEKRERLEQLRALEAGMRMEVVPVNTVPLGVDTPEDAEKAEKLLRG